MEESILNFNQQFDLKPEVINGDKLVSCKKFVVGGMGGSHLGADLLKLRFPSMDFHVHANYGIPDIAGEEKNKHLFIALSYSGNTEETNDFANKAYQAGFRVAVVSTGGKLIDFAKEKGLPYILIPDTGIQPRISLGYQSVALARLMLGKAEMSEVRSVSDELQPLEYKSVGNKLSKKVAGKIPVIYSSVSNRALAYSWKIMFNESAKIPAFCNVFPELNHNEMQGFQVSEKLNSSIVIIMLSDEEDSSRIQDRMSVTKEVLENSGLQVEKVKLPDGTGSNLSNIYGVIVLGYWTALFLARELGVDPEKIPFIEDFKKRIG